ncbi:MAG: hypothetical protein HQL69_15355 [Magnetococcales bacterium]|nr:hypothetical protein [Magnetococcales bacterium]
MANVVFYEKPGCVNNLLQKALLKTSGHVVTERNILTANWTSEGLLWFFSDLPVREWFNRSAPMVKSGKICPDQLSEKQALELMVADPLLIRRPLMDVNGFPVVGFNLVELDRTIGIDEGDSPQKDVLQDH